MNVERLNEVLVVAEAGAAAAEVAVRGLAHPALDLEPVVVAIVVQRPGCERRHRAEDEPERRVTDLR